MAPPRTMTGDTYTEEKTPQSPVSPTVTDATLTEEVVAEIAEAPCSTVRPPSLSVDLESAQPRR